MWHNGYLEQARSDWEVYNRLWRASVADCHTIHYLQMTTEKLGKALLLVRGTPLEHMRRSHRAFTRFLQIATRNRGLQMELEMTASQLRRYIQQLLPMGGVEKPSFF